MGSDSPPAPDPVAGLGVGHREAAGPHPRLSGTTPGKVALFKVQIRVHALVKNADDHQLGFGFTVEDNVLLDGLGA